MDEMMTDAEAMVMSSLQVFMADPKKPKPVSFGSGFIISYLDRLFFVSVSHVTDRKGVTTYLETNIPFQPSDGPILKHVSEICYVDLLDTANIQTPDDLKQLIESGKRKRLDICFAEYKPDGIPLYQLPMDFQAFRVPYHEKIILDMDHICMPDEKERYGFYGQITPRYAGQSLIMTPTLKHSLKYVRSNKDFHLFASPITIKTKQEFAGCSGAPILDSQHRLVAIACEVLPKSKWIYGIPIQKCKQLIDYAITTKML